MTKKTMVLAIGSCVGAVLLSWLLSSGVPLAVSECPVCPACCSYQKLTNYYSWRWTPSLTKGYVQVTPYSDLVSPVDTNKPSQLTNWSGRLSNVIGDCTGDAVDDEGNQIAGDVTTPVQLDRWCFTSNRVWTLVAYGYGLSNAISYIKIPSTNDTLGLWSPFGTYVPFTSNIAASVDQDILTYVGITTKSNAANVEVILP